MNSDPNPFVVQPEPPSYFDLRSERDELAVRVSDMALLMERLEDQVKTYKHRGDMLQGALMQLRDEALSFCKLYDSGDRTKLGGEVEALNVRGLGANAALAAYGEDPY